MAAAPTGTVLGAVDVEIRARLDEYMQGLSKARAEAAKFEQQSSRSMQNVTGATNKANASARDLTSSFGKMAAAAGGLLGALAATQFVALADIWSDLRSRLAAIVGGFQNVDEVMTRLEVVARRTYSSFQLTAESFIFNSQALRDLGYSTRQQLDFTEALNNALVVSGAKGERAAQIQRNLSRAIGQGALRGEELNNIMAVGGRVASVLAEALTATGEHGKVTTNDLRRLGQEGIITTSVLIQALLGNLGKLRDEADAMPATVGDAFLRMRNEVLAFIGTVDQSIGLTQTLAENMIAFSLNVRDAAKPTIEFLQGLSKPLTDAGFELQDLILAGNTFFQVVLLTHGVRAITVLTALLLGPMLTAIRVTALALWAHPFFLMVGIFALLVAAAFQFREALLRVFGVDVVARAQDLVFLVSLRTKFPDVELQLGKLLDEIPAGGSAGDSVNEKGAEMAPNDANKVADLEKQVADLTTKLTKATEDLTAAAAETKKATDSLAALTTEKADLAVKAGMSDGEKDHWKGLSKEKQAEFSAMSPAERKKAMAAKAADDESITIEGEAVKKSVVGEQQFRIMKAQAERLANAEKVANEERAARETAELTKRADAEFPHVPGTPAERADVLRAISKMAEGLQKSFMAILTQSEKLAKAGFSKLGSGGGESLTEVSKAAAAAFEGKIAEVRKNNPKLSRTQALEQARKSYPTEFQAYQDEGAIEDPKGRNRAS